jgi:hypothetical protein
MMSKGFAPEKFIDREAEQELFEELLKFQDDSRLLTIRDEGGRGKSSLLKMLEYKCVWRHDPPTPVSLVPLDQLPDNTPFSLIKNIRDGLSKLPFKKFDELDAARASRDFSKFRAPSGDVRGAVNAQGANISGPSTVGGVVVQSHGPTHIGSGDWVNAEQEVIARRACIEAFFEDLKQICSERKIVVFLDSWERSNDDLQEWILSDLILPLCFEEDRPEQFVLVLTGRELPDFKVLLGAVRYQRLVKSIESLGEWEENHVIAFLRVHGYEGLNDEDIEYLCSRIKRGLSLEKALRILELIRVG